MIPQTPMRKYSRDAETRLATLAEMAMRAKKDADLAEREMSRIEKKGMLVEELAALAQKPPRARKTFTFAIDWVRFNPTACFKEMLDYIDEAGDNITSYTVESHMVDVEGSANYVFDFIITPAVELKPVEFPLQGVNIEKAYERPKSPADYSMARVHGLIEDAFKRPRFSLNPREAATQITGPAPSSTEYWVPSPDGSVVLRDIAAPMKEKEAFDGLKDALKMSHGNSKAPAGDHSLLTDTLRASTRNLTAEPSGLLAFPTATPSLDQDGGQ